MRVGDVCNKTVVTADPSLGVVEAAQRMRERHVGTLVLTRDRDGMPVPIGIVTDRDLVVEVLAKQVPAERVCLRDLVIGPLRTAEADDELVDTLDRMRVEGIRRMPVVDFNGHLVGILSADDILGPLSKLIGMMPKLSRRQRAVEAARRD